MGDAPTETDSNKLIQMDCQKCRAFCKERKSPANFGSPLMRALGSYRMENHATAIEKIRTEVKGDLTEVQNKFLEHFENDVEEFIELMANAFIMLGKVR